MSNAPSVVDTVPVWDSNGSIVYVSTNEALPEHIRTQIRTRAEVMETWREVVRQCGEWAIENPQQACVAGEFVLRIVGFAGVIGGIIYFVLQPAKMTQ